MYLIYCDSSIAPFNPGGILTWAFIAKAGGKVLHQDTKIIGYGKMHLTNNVGELTAVLAAIRWLLSLPQNKRRTALLMSDSQLAIKQASEAWQCHDEKLQPILELILKGKRTYGKTITFKWIPREKNTEADELSRSLYTEEALAVMKANHTNIIQEWDDIDF
jgi:ribonuclease HI